MAAIRYAEGNKIDYTKKIAIRKLPEIWTYRSYDTKIEEMITKIIDTIENGRCNLNNKNRFVIFTRLVNEEACRIEKYLQDHNERFEEFSIEASSGKITYKIVTGSSETGVGEFSHNGLYKPLPDILIITYQISEAGVNLPGFNYVINFHIPAYPASLEQRFGRVDRMGDKNGTQYKELHMVFLLLEIGMETNKMNFYNAIWLYRNSIISCIPSKNSVLTSDIIHALQSDKELLGEYYGRLLEMCKDDNYLEIVYNCLRANTESDDVLMEHNTESVKTLMDFCKENELMSAATDNSDGFVEFQKTVEETLLGRREEISRLSRTVDDEIILRIIHDSGDKIFYVNKAEVEKCETGEDISSKITWYDPIKDCAKNIIESDSYTEYEKKFNQLIKKPWEISRVRAKFRNQVEEFFERQFCHDIKDYWKEHEGSHRDPIFIGRLKNIFVDDYKKLFSDKWSDITKEEKDKDADIFLESCCDKYNIRGWLEELPFFIMCRKFGEYLYDVCFCRKRWEKGLYFKDQFKGAGPLVEAFYKLELNHYIPDFIKYKCDKKKNYFDLFTTYWFPLEEKGGYGFGFVCSNWLQLAFISFEAIDCPSTIKYILQKIDYLQKGNSESLDYQSRDDFPKTWNYSRNLFCDIILTENGSNWREFAKHSPSTTYLLPYYKFGTGFRNWTLNEAKDDKCKVYDIWTYIILKLLMEESYGRGKFRYIVHEPEYLGSRYRGNLEFVVNDLLLLLKENPNAPYPFPGQVLDYGL